MKDYFNKAIELNVSLKIDTAKGKSITVYAIKYDDDMLYYHFKDTQNDGQIYIKNIVKIEFEDEKIQKEFMLQKLNLPHSIDEYLNYYNQCIEEANKNQKEARYNENDVNLRKELFQCMFDNLYKKDENNLLVRYFKGIKEIEKSGTHSCILLSQSNLSQKQAIINALNNSVSIIQGPPGTGKTTTILSLIANFIMDNKKVVVVSKNNSAVNNIIEEYQKTDLPEFYLRFGSKEKVMNKLLEDINYKLAILNADLLMMKPNDVDLNKLTVLKEQLENLESEIDELIELKSLIAELKNEKRFVDKKMKVYNFKQYLNNNELKILREKYANLKIINRLICLANKHKYSFFERMIIKLRYCLRKGDIELKLNALVQLLEELYMNKEIALKETKLLNAELEEKQKKVLKLYEEYTSLCKNSFKEYLRQNMNVPVKSIKTKKDLIDLAFTTYPLILTTADAFLYNFVNKFKNGEEIDCVIIDEASQCDVVTGLPLLYLAKKIVVVGDSKQLGAIANTEVETNIADYYKYKDNTFLNTIQTAFNPPEKTLEEHYRCDYNIINFCNKYYYQNKLKIYTSAKKNAISIMNVDQYKGAEPSFVNKREVKSIIEAVNKNADIFTITPYSNQANLLVETYGDKKAGTIHTFQGRGADKVYFSTVLNDFDYCIRHLESSHNMFKPELINVAVSRAKKEFILVTDKNFFTKYKNLAPEVNHLIDYIEIYGDKIDDRSTCIFDYLYEKIPFYQSNDLFDNEYEETLFNVITQILNNSPYKCYPKLKLYELVFNEKFLYENPDIKQYIVNNAHADFTIIDERIGKPVVVIELNGQYHETEKQKIRDRMKEKALMTSNINLITIKSKDALNYVDVKNILTKYINL